MLSQAKHSRALRKRLHCRLRFRRPEILSCSQARQIQQPPFFSRPSPPPRSVLVACSCRRFRPPPSRAFVFSRTLFLPSPFLLKRVPRRLLSLVTSCKIFPYQRGFPRVNIPMPSDQMLTTSVCRSILKIFWNSNARERFYSRTWALRIKWACRSFFNWSLSVHPKLKVLKDLDRQLISYVSICNCF